MNCLGFRNFFTSLQSDNDRPIWLPLWALGLSVGWLLPNHNPPWAAFLVDAWIACFYLIAALVLIVNTRAVFTLQSEALVIFLVATIPAVQYVMGMLPYAGTAWIGVLFVLGFACAILLGSAWERHSLNTGINALFFAIGFASVVSVGMQLYQWLGLEIEAFSLWILAVPNNRPFANLAQPNQLATLLVWGLIATARGATQRMLSKKVAVVLALYLLMGIALTQSRTAFVALLLSVPISIFSRRFGVKNSTVWTVVALAVAYLVMIWAIPHLHFDLDAGHVTTMMQRDSASLRLAAYRMFIDAVWQAPWTGYGWSQTALAQLEVAGSHPSMSSIFMHSHNLFLDFLIWCGLPIGLLMSGAVVYWGIKTFLNLASIEDVLLLAFVAMVGWHAMVELPLHYAYFLLPTGLVIGAISQRTRSTRQININWPYTLGLFVLAGVLLGIVIRDYLLVEKSFYAMRFERARIGSWPVDLDESPVLLDQLEAFVEMGRRNAKRNMTDSEIESLRKASSAYPSLGNFYTLITAMALNGRMPEAQKLVENMPKITTAHEYTQMKNIWERSALNDHALTKIHWPAIDK